MYQRDVPDILSYVQNTGPDAIVDVGAFVLCTIQTPLSRVGNQMLDIKRFGNMSKALWGVKRKGYNYISNAKSVYYKYLVEDTPDKDKALDIACHTPGFGLPKGGFFLQCLGYDLSCLDGHNLKRFGIDPKIVKRKDINNYIKVCDDIGNSEFFWDSWCTYVAGNRVNKKLPTADIVSRYHYKCIEGEMRCRRLTGRLLTR